MTEQTKSEEISEILLESISNFDTPENEKTTFKNQRALEDLIISKGRYVNQSEVSKHLKKLGIYKSKDGNYTAPVKLLFPTNPKYRFRFIEFADNMVLQQVNFKIELDNPESRMMILSIDPKFISLLMDNIKKLYEGIDLQLYLFPNTDGELLLIYNSKKSESTLKKFPKRMEKLSTYIKNRIESSGK